MSQPCAASATLASNVFWSFRKLSYASITRQQPTAFLTTTRTSYQTSISLSRSNPTLRCFHAYPPTYNSIPQSHAEDATTPSTAKGEPSTKEEPTTQSEPAQTDDPTAPPSGEKRVKPRRHRKDKPAQEKPNPKQPIIKYVNSKDPDTPITWKKKEQWQIQKEALNRNSKTVGTPERSSPPTISRESGTCTPRTAKGTQRLTSLNCSKSHRRQFGGY